MTLSQKKQDKMARSKRAAEVNARSLNGAGYFMDANHDSAARQYVETGDEKFLEMLPDYRVYREADKKRSGR